MKALAEAIILQSLEDLWDERHRNESLKFFNGRGFRMCSGIAGMGQAEKKALNELFGQMGINVPASAQEEEPEKVTIQG